MNIQINSAINGYTIQKADGWCDTNDYVAKSWEEVIALLKKNPLELKKAPKKNAENEF